MHRKRGDPKKRKKRGGIPTLDYVIFDEAMRNSEGRRRMEAQRFFDGRVEVRQCRPVLERRESLAAHDGVELGLNALLHVGEEDHAEQEGGDTRRRLCRSKNHNSSASTPSYKRRTRRNKCTTY